MAEDATSKKTPLQATHTNADSVCKMRRRLTVTSESDFIEGVESLSLSPAARRTSISIREAAEGSHIAPIYGVSRKGYAPYNPRKKNQDALHIVEDPATGTRAILVLDGHGEAGAGVSGYFKDRFCDETFTHPEWRNNKNTTTTDDHRGVAGMKVAIAATIAKLEGELIHAMKGAVDMDFSGSTFVFAAMRDGVLLVANIGDSRVTLATEAGDHGRGGTSKRLVARPISRDHKPDSPAEKARIQDAGGRVFAVEYDDGIDGPARVWLGHMDVPGLAMSRSIGDVVAHTAGVSSEAEFFVHEISNRDHFLVAATDGLWEFVTDDEVVALVNKTALATGSPKACVDALIELSNARWMMNEQVIDDTTVCVAFFADHLPKSS